MPGFYDNFVVQFLSTVFVSETHQMAKMQLTRKEFKYKNTNVSIWHVGIIFIGVPTKSQDFVGKRRQKKRYFLPLDFPQQKRSSRSSRGEAIASLRGANEFSPLGGNERYGACDDVQGLGKATPQQDSAQTNLCFKPNLVPR